MKLNTFIPSEPAFLLLKEYKKEMHIYVHPSTVPPQKYLYINAYNSITYNSQKLCRTCLSANSRIDE